VAKSKPDFQDQAFFTTIARKYLFFTLFPEEVKSIDSEYQLLIEDHWTK